MIAARTFSASCRCVSCVRLRLQMPLSTRGGAAVHVPLRFWASVVKCDRARAGSSSRRTLARSCALCPCSFAIARSLSLLPFSWVSFPSVTRGLAEHSGRSDLSDADLSEGNVMPVRLPTGTFCIVLFSASHCLWRILSLRCSTASKEPCR